MGPGKSEFEISNGRSPGLLQKPHCHNTHPVQRVESTLFTWDWALLWKATGDAVNTGCSLRCLLFSAWRWLIKRGFRDTWLDHINVFHKHPSNHLISFHFFRELHIKEGAPSQTCPPLNLRFSSSSFSLSTSDEPKANTETVSALKQWRISVKAKNAKYSPNPCSLWSKPEK